MKKTLLSFVCLIALSVAAIPVGAQTRSRRYDQRFDQGVYSGRQYNRNWYDDRSTWDKHRDKITTAAGAGAGALLGALAGGTKGAIIGALVGGGGAAVYTYGIRDDHNDDWRYRNRRRY
jgi:hypothetical protein